MPYPSAMHRLLPLLPLMAALFALSACATYESSGPGRPYAPAVYIPHYRDGYEARYLSTVESTLLRAGYQLSRSRSAEYELDFRIESGPVNTDTYLTLLRDRREIVKAYARGSGLFKRDQVIRQSFDKCLLEFENRLPHVRSHSRDAYNGAYGPNDGYPPPRQDNPYRSSPPYAY